jgi:hypothetical protein
MDQKRLTFSYDPKSDVLYGSFGEPCEAISEETAQGVILRFDPETKELVGFTVLAFLRRFKDHPGEPIRLLPSELEEFQPA